jgi:uncharacterized protein (TIGR00106 family)
MPAVMAAGIDHRAGTTPRKEDRMRAIADISIVPLGVGLSLSSFVAACEQVLADADLNPRLHAYGTNVEGEWDDVVAALKRCHEVLHEMGAPRVSTNLRLGTRTDKKQSAADKIASVKRKLEGEKVKR